MSPALIPREQPRLTVQTTQPQRGVIRSVRDAFGTLWVTFGNRIFRRRGLMLSFETVNQSLPTLHDIEREPSGALHIHGSGGERLVSTDGGETWQSLT